MRRLLISILLLYWFVPVFGQSEYIDSLKNVLKHERVDSSKVSTLIELCSQYYRSDPKEALKIATQAKELAQKSKFPSGLAYAHKAIGMSYYFQNDWIDALVEWKLALEVFESINDLNGVSNMLNNLGAVHFNGGDDEKAIDYYLQSLRVAEQTNDSLRIVTALVNIGTVYFNKPSSRNLAFEYYQRALPMSAKLGNYDALGTCAVNMGEIYLQDKNNPDSALIYFEEALDSYQKSATGNIAFALKSIGRVYAARREFDKAIQFQTEAYQLATSQDARLEMAQSLLSLADTYQSKGDIPKAIEILNKAKELAEAIGAQYEMTAAYKELATNYSDISDYKKAYKNQVLFSSLKDTLYNAQMDKKLQAQSLSYEIEKKQGQISLLEKDQELKEVELKRQKAIRNGAAALGLLLLVIVGGLFNRYKYTKKTNKIIEAEKERAETLLLNILPAETAEELKTKGYATPKFYEKVTVLFTDFKGFTNIAEKLTPQELVEELNQCFIAFDNIIDKYKLEKIKTIGDAYMCAGGIPGANETNPIDIVKAALEIRDFMKVLGEEKKKQGKESWELRIGIHTGPLIAGVVGKNKFAYDIWGDAVNIASRMESSGEPGEINISGETQKLIIEYFETTYRGKIKAKNKGEIDMYFVTALKNLWK